jgi:hypothetical protein
VLYLPRNLAPLARLTRPEDRRYALDRVRVLDPGDTTYRVEVTDGRLLLVVRGNVVADNGAAVGRRTPSAREALILAKDWEEGLRLSAKDRVLKDKGVCLALGRREAVFATRGQSLTVPRPEGLRWPNVDGVLPKRPPVLQVKVDPRAFAQLLATFAALGCEGVGLLFYGGDVPLGLAARTEQGQFLDGLLMPLG